MEPSTNGFGRSASFGLLRTIDLAAILAVVMPTLLAFNLPPSSTFFNQAAALLGWGAFVAALSLVVSWPGQARRRELLLLLVPMGVLAVEAAISVGINGLPSSLGLSAIGILLAAGVATLAGAASRESDSASEVFRAFCIALVGAGFLGATIGCIQILLPDWAQGAWIAAAPADGRASGNLRQPNHLSSLLVWAIVALTWLAQSRVIRPLYALPVGLFFVFGIVLTGSRTGLLDFGLLTVWALIDRRLPTRVRIGLGSSLLVYWALWWAMADWAHAMHATFGGEARMGMQGDISSSRYGIWRDTWQLILQHPWFGVGWGEFNFAWSLTPFPHRPVAFFDHTHNIALQFAVELGLPLAAVLMLFLLAGLACVFLNGQRADPGVSAMVRTTFMIVLTIGVHSMLEYPLWYSYFLLPTGFAFGFGLAGSPCPAKTEGASPRPSSRRLGVMAILLMLGGAGALLDYHRVSVIFEAGDGTSLADRIARGKRSVFFAYHANYAAATTAARPADAMAAFPSATQNLLDTRLMMAWAKAYAERGDVERARHLAERLREFHNEDSADFFAPCEEEAQPVPFQCDKPTRAMDYRDFK